MTKSAPALVRLQEELVDVGSMAEGLNQRAEEILEALGRIIHFDSGWLAVRDPERRRHVPLATTGAAEPLRRYFESPGADAEVEHLGLNSAQRPVLASELPMPLPEISAWGEYLLPAGFRGGVAGPCSPRPGGTWASSASSSRTRCASVRPTGRSSPPSPG